MASFSLFHNFELSNSQVLDFSNTHITKLPSDYKRSTPHNYKHRNIFFIVMNKAIIKALNEYATICIASLDFYLV